MGKDLSTPDFGRHLLFCKIYLGSTQFFSCIELGGQLLSSLKEDLGTMTLFSVDCRGAMTFLCLF